MIEEHTCDWDCERVCGKEVSVLKSELVSARAQLEQRDEALWEAVEWLESRPDFTEGDAAVASRGRATLAAVPAARTPEDDTPEGEAGDTLTRKEAEGRARAVLAENGLTRTLREYHLALDVLCLLALTPEAGS